MKRVLTSVALTIVGLAMLAGPATAAHITTTTVALNGAQEVGGGDRDGSGTIDLAINRRDGEICFELRTRRIAAPSAAHIHEAPRGVNGPVVVGLFSGADGNNRTGCVDVTPALAQEIVADPADYYVNVHNGEFPAGAVRGQLH